MGWLDGISKKLHGDDTTLSSVVADYINVSPKAKEQLEEIQNLTRAQIVLVGTACTFAFGIGFKAGRVRPSWRRFTSVTDISSSDIGPNAPFLRGRAVSVSDGDTIRFLHVPTLLHSPTLKEGEKLSETALAIRICTIDTPETAKFGKPGQAFGDKAKEHLETMVLNKSIKIKILQKDQYGRAVAEVKTAFPPFFGKYMDEQMLKAGLAEVYRGGGAVYGHLGMERYVDMEQTAKDKKVGMWSLEKRESAAEYKARMKQEK